MLVSSSGGMNNDVSKGSLESLMVNSYSGTEKSAKINDRGIL